MKNENTYKELIIEYLEINGKSKVDDLFKHINTNKEVVGKTVNGSRTKWKLS